MKLFTDITELENAFAELSGQLGAEQTSRALRMAINDTMRKQRTQLRQYVRHTYNIPGDKINSIDFGPATTYNLESKMFASHSPVQLAYFKPIFSKGKSTIRGSYSKKKGLSAKKGRSGGPEAGVSVEIKKEQRVTILFAFMVEKFEKPFVFARGQYQKGKGFVRGKPRMPISVLSSASVFSAAFGTDRRPGITKSAYTEFAQKANEYLQKIKDGVIK